MAIIGLLKYSGWAEVRNDMKKLMILFAAMLLCCGCSGKKKNEEKPIPEDITDTENTEDTAEEEPFLTLKDSDYKEIIVPVTVKDDVIPDEVKFINTNELDFGEKIPVCVTADNWQDYYPEYLYDDSAEGISEHEIQMRDAIRSPQKGDITEYTMGDGMLFFFVNYDNYCSSSGHSTAFFKYDIAEKKLSEIVSYDTLENNKTIGIMVNSMKYLDGKLYYVGSVPDGDDSVYYGVYSLDTETGEIKLCFEDDDFKDRESPNYPLDTLVCQNGRLYAVDLTYGKESDITAQVIYEMNSETGEWDKVFTEDNVYRPAQICNGGIVTVDRNENKKVCIHTESYDFESPFRNAELIYADDKETDILLADALHKTYNGALYSNCVLHVFDRETMEHYSFDLKELGSATEIKKVKNGYLITNREGFIAPVYYLMPDLGIAFQVSLGKSGSGNVHDEDVLYYLRNILSINDNNVTAFNYQELMYMEK